MNIDIKKLTIRQAHEDLVKGLYTSCDLVKAHVDEIQKKDKDIHAFLEVFSDVIEQAKSADKQIADLKKQNKEIPLLMGIPLAIKDNILINGRKVSSASKILEGYSATYDATVIKKLKEQGVVFVGRTNMDEFAMGGSTENSAFGVTKNPYDVERVAGGSSGGSAAAVAMSGALGALGSDTGGSIRQPASFCGLVGLKPTYGRVSRYGVMAMGSSLDQIGPFAKNIDDARIIYDCIKGTDTKDGTTISDNTYSKKRISKKKPTIGIPRHFLKGDGIDKNTLNNFNETVERLKNSGYDVKDINLPNIAYSLAVYYVIMPAEVSSNMARFDGVRFGLHKDGKNGIEDYFETRGAGFGKEVRRRILLGTYVLSSGYYDAYYNRANAVRRILIDDFKKAFEQVDAVLTPTTPAPAFKIGEKASDPIAMYLEDIFTVTANLTGMPAISVPSGMSEVGGKSLPLGIQITTRHGDEETAFEIGQDIQVGC
jgi:aspartyl-tRNA(Asn)/glutamyl-tRNA(Gln) amidotransferase subunit A